ncbi:MAG TPA: DUF742 domain-containing protein [Streptosporangiaceae bacterium]
MFPPDGYADGQWVDEDAGPVVRPYALTGGRTRPVGESFDLLALVCAVRGAIPDVTQLEPEQLTVLRKCRVPIPAADLASDLDLPLGVVRILVSDLRERGLVTVHGPVAVRLADPQLLKDVADGLRRI